jgi:hypothetical protein
MVSAGNDGVFLPFSAKNVACRFMAEGMRLVDQRL